MRLALLAAAAILAAGLVLFARLAGGEGDGSPRRSAAPGPTRDAAAAPAREDGRETSRALAPPAPHSAGEPGEPTASREGSSRRTEGRGRPERPRERAAGSATLGGAVLSSEGPVRGASLRLRSHDGQFLAEATSDVRGGFVLAVDEPVEEAVLEVEARGYAPLRSGPHSVRPGERRLLGNVRLVPGVALTGRVTSASGAPVGGARVRLLADGAPGSEIVGGETRSDDHGRFVLPEAPQGRVRLEASAPGHGSRTVQLRHAPGGGEIAIVLLPEARLAVRVRNPKGEPVEGALVRLVPRSPSAAPAESRTGADGRARFEGLGGREFQLRATASGHEPVAREKVEAGGELELVMKRWPCLSGRVRAPGGDSPPAGTTVLLVVADSRGGLTPASGAEPRPVEADGSFRICDLRPGEYAVRARAPGYAPSHSAPTSVGASDVEGVRVDLAQGGVLALTPADPALEWELELRDAPPAPAEVWSPGAPGAPPLARAGGAGELVFEHLAPGRYWVIARAEDRLPETLGPREVREGRRTDVGPVALGEGGRILGRVRDADGGPVGGASIVLVPEREPLVPVPAETDASGRFASPPLPPGSWRVTARDLGAAGRVLRTATATVTVRVGQAAEVDLVTE